MQYDRKTRFDTISQELSCLDDVTLTHKLLQAEIQHQGVGGSSVVLQINGQKVFVKLVPITDLEMQSKGSTQNLFNLPMCYHYSVGSTGFGVWRELSSHNIVNEWVLTNKCCYFPLLFHNRVLPAPKGILDTSSFQSLSKHTDYWGGSNTISDRYAQIIGASNMLCLFMEYVPDRLDDWIKNAISQKQLTPRQIIDWVTPHLKEASCHMRNNSFTHLDSHFSNILTDGEMVYFCDYGLALSDQFDLSRTEEEFLNEHLDFDKYFTFLNLVLSIVVAMDNDDAWSTYLHDYDKWLALLEPSIDKSLSKYMNDSHRFSELMDGFYQNLIHKDKNTTYPGQKLEKLYNLALSKSP